MGSSLFFISGLRFLPIAEASATGFVSPLFVTALSIVFLGESVGVRRWLATAVGLIGVLIILRPGSSAFHPAAFFPIVSALAWACTLIMTRMMSGKERAITTMTYSSIAGVCILSALVPFVWVAPSWHDILFGIFIGVASTAGQWIVVLAFRYADASVLAPFSYTQLLWVSILGFVIFGEMPDIWTVIGAVFIVASGLYTAHRERVRRLQLSRCRPSRLPTPDRRCRLKASRAIRVNFRGMREETTLSRGNADCALPFSGTARSSSIRCPSQSRPRARYWSRRWPAASADRTCMRASTPIAWSNWRGIFPAASRWTSPATWCSATNSAARSSITGRRPSAS